jgi:hypothetical protein
MHFNPLIISASLLVGSVMAAPHVGSRDLATRDSAAPNGDGAWQKYVLDLINYCRWEHGAMDVTWDYNASAVAVQNANKCQLVHSVICVYSIPASSS